MGGRPGTWIARRKSNGELVVLHCIAGGGRTAAILTDAQRAVDVEHTNVVRVRGVETAGMNVVVVTEFVDGEVYADLVDAARERGTRLPLNVSLRVVADVLTGLATMHARRSPVVHGRLAALDVLVGADGISRVTIGARNVRGDEAKVIGYYAPEIILASDFDADVRTDVYAAGVLLWEALAGARLYEAHTAELVLARQLRGDIPAPTLAPDMLWGQPLIPVAIRALATDPKDRYPSAPAMLEALRDAAGSRVARPDDVASLVEQISGPFIRARRREASVALGASDSDIRPTERDTEPEESGDRTLPLAEAPDAPTEVGRPNPVAYLRETELPGKSGIPRLTTPEDEADDAATQVVAMDVEADTLDPTLTAEQQAPRHPADTEQPTLTVDVPPPSEDPSVTSTLPPALKRALLEKHAALQDEDDDDEREVSTLSAASPIGEVYGEGDESVTERRDYDARESHESITLDMPHSKDKLGSVYSGDLATERRHAVPRAAALGRTARSPGIAARDEQDTGDMAVPADPRAMFEEAKRKSGKRPRPVTEEELSETAQMDRAFDSHKHALGNPRTSPMAIPIRPGAMMTTAPMIDAPRYSQQQMAVPAPPPSDPRALAVPPPAPLPSGALHPTVPGQRLAPTISITRERGSSFLLGLLTFLLVLASLVIVAWLTMPYWRAYVEF